MWRRRGEAGGFPGRWTGRTESAARRERQERTSTRRAGSAALGVLGAVVVIGAFHGLFIGSFWKATHGKWLQSPAAMSITLAHATIGAIGSVWLSRIIPRVLDTPLTDGWLSATTASLCCTVATSSWLGYMAFELLPNYERLTGLRFGYVGLFLVIPASIYFWRLGRTFSW